MDAAEALARQLQERFLIGGNFVLAGPAGGSFAKRPGSVQAVTTDAFEDVYDDAGFAGLAVQAVGFEHGVDSPTVHVYVTKGSKKAEREVEATEGPLKVRINRVGRVTVRPEAASTSVHRGQVFVHDGRIACGSSCAPSGENYAGTFGAILRVGGDLHILSNNHVLAACNHTPIGVPILSPSPKDASANPQVPVPRAIARHSRICELRSGDPALVAPCHEDVAIASLIDSNLVSSRQGAGAESYDTPSTTDALRTGMRVKKWGRTTGLTTGAVESKVLPFAMPYKFNLFSATVWFTEVWTIRADQGTSFALGGDSGSLVVDESGSHAVGLVFAATGAGDLAYVVPMAHVLTCFGGASLVRGHHA
jgi:hypothetical protein